MIPRTLPKPQTISHRFILGDCLDVLKSIPDDSIDLVLTSPPYEDARLYGDLNFRVKGEDWVEWAIPRFKECYRVCRGLVAWVVEGKTKDFRYSATPLLLQADLHRAGIRLRKPLVFHRVGIPGSGGPDWMRSDTETIICATKGRLPWADNTSTGNPCKYAPGGAMTYRDRGGRRKNLGDGLNYCPPVKANPGNVIWEFTEVDLCHLLELYCATTNTHPTEVLSQLWEADTTETLAEWGLGISQIILGEKILWESLCRRGQILPPSQYTGKGPREVPSPKTSGGSTMRNVWDQGESNTASYRRKPNQQHSDQYSSIMPPLPQHIAQEIKKSEMYRLWGTKSRGRNVRRTLRQMEASWRSACKMCEHAKGYSGESGDLISRTVGGGKMGHPLAHESEAPFPEALAEFFIKSFCIPGGTVLDPFVGSGTSICVAKKLGRSGIGIEIRQEMIDICNQRISDPVYERVNDDV